jgi:hypothetical protein
MQIKNWKKSVLNRDLWKIIVERTKTHIELWRLPRRIARTITEYITFKLLSCKISEIK